MKEFPQPLPKHFLGRLIRGFSYPAHALLFVFHHRLWGLFWAPVLVNVLLFGASLGLLVWGVGPYVWWLNETLASWAGGFQFEAVIWLVTAVVWIVWIAFGLLALGTVSVLLLLIGQAVAGPFLDTLSERVELIVLGTPEQPFGVGLMVRGLLLGVSDLFWGLVFLVAVNVPLFVIGLTAIAAIPASALSFAFSCMLLAVEFIGLSMARHFVSYRGRWSAMLRHKSIALGFGASSTLLLLVPGLNLVLLPIVAVGGTLAYCELHAAGGLEASWNK